MTNDKLSAIFEIVSRVREEINKEREFINEIMPGCPDRSLLDLRIADIQMRAFAEICSILDATVETATVGQYYMSILDARNYFRLKHKR